MPRRGKQTTGYSGLSPYDVSRYNASNARDRRFLDIMRRNANAIIQNELTPTQEVLPPERTPTKVFPGKELYPDDIRKAGRGPKGPHIEDKARIVGLAPNTALLRRTLGAAGTLAEMLDAADTIFTPPGGDAATFSIPGYQICDGPYPPISPVTGMVLQNGAGHCSPWQLTGQAMGSGHNFPVDQSIGLVGGQVWTQEVWLAYVGDNGRLHEHTSFWRIPSGQPGYVPGDQSLYKDSFGTGSVAPFMEENPNRRRARLSNPFPKMGFGLNTPLPKPDIAPEHVVNHDTPAGPVEGIGRAFEYGGSTASPSGTNVPGRNPTPGKSPSPGKSPTPGSTPPRQIPPTPLATPEPGTKERKVMSRAKRLGIALYKALDKVSESAEVVDALYEALPKAVQKRRPCFRKAGHIDNMGQYGIDNADCKLKVLYDNWHLVDIETALKNIIANEMQDRAYGQFYKYAPKNLGSAVDGGAKQANKGLDWFFEQVGLKEGD